MFSQFDHECMSRAIKLAELGMYTSRPNPRVGCVLAKDGEVVATGWHRRHGQSHAEALALEAAGDAARGATAYVNLEPCSHQGLTPSCAKALIRAGVTRVVSAIGDANPEVNGAGIELLNAAGVVVETGLMQDQAEELNAGFFKRMRDHLPWVRIKLAQSLDGKTALENGCSQWISSEASRQDVQGWRARSCAIMRGIDTVLADDPSLNVRLDLVDTQPLRIIVDSHWRTPASARTLKLPGQVLVVGRNDIQVPKPLAESGAELLPVSATGGQGRVNLGMLMRVLADRAINEIQVEAGATLTGALLDAQLVDEIILYQAPILLGSSARNGFNIGPFSRMDQRIKLQCQETRHFGSDLRLRLTPVYGDS